MSTFEQAYWYTNDCPLRQLDKTPFETQSIPKWFNEHTKDIYLDMFGHRDYLTAQSQFSKRLDELDKIFDKNIKISLFQKSAVNMSLFVAEHEKTPFTKIGKFYNEASYMEAHVDLMREKSNRTAELLWLKFDLSLPTINDQNILSSYAHWNARAFELEFETRPYLLTFYYPFLGESIMFMYNVENGLDTVSLLLKNNAYYTRPNRIRCLSCRRCPEFRRVI